MAGITYLDRVCISILAPSIMKDLRLGTIQMGYVFSAFTLAYAGLEIPTAWWADRIGSRRVLTRIVLWWSGFTMLTGAAFSSYASGTRARARDLLRRRAPGGRAHTGSRHLDRKLSQMAAGFRFGRISWDRLGGVLVCLVSR